MRPLRNASFCPISASGSNFNPRNIQCITVVKIIVFLSLEPRLNIKNAFNWTGKIERFSKVSIRTSDLILAVAVDPSGAQMIHHEDVLCSWPAASV
jgi:hypothetical protein